MDKMTAYCGINCAECPAYLATKNNDDALRQETAKTWSQMFQADIKPEHVNCMGCKSDVLFVGHCLDCNIRLCNMEKANENCSACEAYGCEKLQGFWEMAPDTKTVLDELRKK